MPAAVGLRPDWDAKRVRAAAREAKDKGTFGYVDTSPGCWELDRYMLA